MYSNHLSLHDRLEEILESIKLIQEWSKGKKTGNLISHEYANIDEEIVVSIINDDIPKLKETIENMLKIY